MPKVSIIVPVYNQSKEINRCVQSLVNQTISDLEIILVDDGSTDGSSGICDSYAEKYENIRVIHKKNGGLSSARNTGVRASKGEYIAFVDSDDWIERDTYAYCLKLMEKAGADIAKFDYSFVYSEEERIAKKKESIKVFNGKEILQYYMEDTTKTGSYGVCWYLIPRIALQDEFFREGKINEDIDYTYRFLKKCKRMVVSNQVKYYYYQKQSSMSTGGLKRKDFDLYEAADELCNLTANEQYGSISYLARVKKARTPLSLLCKIAYYGIQDKSLDKEETVNRLQVELRRSLGLLLKSPISNSRKILALLFSINYPMTEGIVHILRR